VVSLRVCEHERGEPADAEASQLPRHVGFRRALIDQHSALGHLEQDRVALADIEEGDPQAGRRRQPRFREQLPGEENGKRCCGEREREGPPPPRQSVQRDQRNRGIAAALVEAAAAAARQAGADELWLVTTNDNLDALRLYQRHGFRLAEIRPAAVDEARRRKPEIPLAGDYGIPLRDELVLVRTLEQ